MKGSAFYECVVLCILITAFCKIVLECDMGQFQRPIRNNITHYTIQNYRHS